MGAQGTTTLDFGAFPGSAMAITDVVAAGVVAGSLIEAWIIPVATADHTDADHIVEGIEVRVAYVSDGNIRIYGYNRIDLMPPQELVPNAGERPANGKDNKVLFRADAPKPVGLFSVGWVWN